MKVSNHGFSVTGTAPRLADQHLRRTRAKSSFLAALVLFFWSYVWFYLGSSEDSPSFLRHWWKHPTEALCQKGTAEEMIYDFNDITPSEKLQWHPCFDRAKCARLTVPMDYNRPLKVSREHPKVHIALSMVPGVGHNQTGNYSTSPLLLNPGGPGGSGVAFVLGAGDQIQSIVSTDGSQDVLGFDPRGVGATTPHADCWSYPSEGNSPSSEDMKQGAYNQMTWTLLGAAVPLVNATENALALRDRRARAVSELCKQHDDLDGEDSILRHLSTPAVAHDMLSIIDAWDEWRAETHQDDTDDQTLDTNGAAENAYSLATEGKLVYWGFSYGTLLGATFAAMFPERVGRVVLDGVVDADYYVSPIWAESLRDADLIDRKFYTYCREAGTLCHIYRDGDTEDDIRARVQNLMVALKKDPIGGISPITNLPFTFTHDRLKSLRFVGLYSPVLAFPLIAEFFDILQRRDEEQLRNRFFVYYPSYKPFCAESMPAYLGGQEAQLAIMCSDKRYPLNETLPNLEKRFTAMANISSFADVWMSLMLGCDAYNITPTDPPMRWDDHPAHKQKPINTSFPLLFLSNTADPVTPLYAGVKMARKFVDAGLIEQKSEGHCSLAAVSRCTMEWVREYFEKGSVPKKPQLGPDEKEMQKGVWTRCEVDERPWKPFRSEVWMAEMEGRHRDEATGELVSDVEGAVRKEWSDVRRMAAWKEVQKVAKTFIRPRNMIGDFHPDPW